MASAKLSLLFGTICAAIFAQPAGTGVISGTVVEASSGDPVRKAVVTATWQGSPRSWATTRTDSSGRFSFEALPPGKYNLTANKPGLGTASYGSNSVRELPDFVSLADGETCADLKLRILHSGSISGHVVDADGDPVPAVFVNMLRAGRNLGERTLVNYRGDSTNDRGEYKITGVDPGEYYLHAEPTNQRNRQGPNADIIGAQYYNGARNSNDAAALYLRGGEVLSGIDFHLLAEHPAKITGRVTGVPQLDPPVQTPGQFPPRIVNGGRLIHNGQDPMVEISPAEGNQMWSNGVGAQGPDYHFELPENAPGRYRVQARINVGDKTYYATQTVDAGEGVTDILLNMYPAVEVKGHLKIEGPTARPPQTYTVVLAGPPPRRESSSSPVAKDGSFTIKQVPPGEWILNINPASPGLFEKSVHLGDKDFLFKRVEIPPGLDAPLNIVLSTNTATVEGEIDSGRAGILLTPVGMWHTMARFYYSATTDATGKFKLTGVAPGKYKIFALEKIATANYRNPESADLLDPLGEEIEIAEGAKIQSHPKLIPEEKAKDILKP
jgi:Carboxypeptidase regulatory-like domain